MVELNRTYSFRLACFTLFLTVLLFVSTGPAHAQELSERERTTVDLNYEYSVVPEITYTRASNVDQKLDLYLPRDAKERGRVPVLMYIHGGGWIWGGREGAVPNLFPYMARGWAAVNLTYRFANVAHAPAAVEDVRCALRWVIDHAAEWNLDPDRIVVTGHSAGGHLSLAAGLITPEAGLDNACPWSDTPLRVAAVVNWYGISDVADLLEGPNRKTYAVSWLGSQLDRKAVADRVSPLHYVSKNAPPVISIHGNADDVVPYEHSVRLHQALQAAGVPNELVTIDRGGHGNFTREEMMKAFTRIDAFLDRYVPETPKANASP